MGPKVNQYLMISHWGDRVSVARGSVMFLESPPKGVQIKTCVFSLRGVLLSTLPCCTTGAQGFYGSFEIRIFLYI